jgi:hypothetical protein
LSNPFAPSAAPVVQAPVQYAPPPVQAPVQYAPPPVQASSGGLDDPGLYQGGHNTPLLPNTLDGRWDLQILAVVGSKGYESGPAVHISFRVLNSTNPDIGAGQDYRIFYKFDYERCMPVPGKQGTVHASLLGKFVAALFKRDFNDPSFSKTQALDSICTNARGNLPGHDFGSAPGYVTLMGELRDRTVTDAASKLQTKSRLRSDIWLPAPNAAQ